MNMEIVSECFQMKADFSEWLILEIKKRGWSQADLARETGITSGGVSNLFNSTRGPSPETCISIARAFGYPPELVFRKAGLLPEKSETDQITEQAIFLFKQLGLGDKEEIIELMEAKIRRAELNREANDVAARLEDLPPAAVEEFVKILDDYLSKHGYKRVP